MPAASCPTTSTTPCPKAVPPRTPAPPTSTTAAPPATTAYGASTAAAKAPPTRSPRRRRSAPPGLTPPRSTSFRQSLRPHRPEHPPPGEAEQGRAVLGPSPLTYASWANPIEAHFGPLRQFTLANSHHRNHPAQIQALHHYLRAGATPTPATPTSSPPSARNAPASAAKWHPLGRTPPRTSSLAVPAPPAPSRSGSRRRNAGRGRRTPRRPATGRGGRSPATGRPGKPSPVPLVWVSPRLISRRRLRAAARVWSQVLLLMVPR